MRIFKIFLKCNCLFSILLIYCNFSEKAEIMVWNTPFDFGFVPEDNRVSVSYPVKNTGNSELIINKVRTSCGCTRAEGFKKSLFPGEETKVELIFNSRRFRNRVKKEGWINSNAANNQKIKLTFSAYIVDVDTMYDKAVLLPDPWVIRDPCEESPQKVTLTNQGSERAKIKIVKFDHDVLKVKLKNKKLLPGEKTELLVWPKRKILNSKSVTLELKDVAESRITIPIEKCDN